MRKQKYDVFDNAEYSERQQHIIRCLIKRYPKFKWKQLLSPYHCAPIYEELLDISEEESVFTVYNELIGKFGNITVYLDFALKLFTTVRDNWHYDSAYDYLRNCYNEDGDKLAMTVLRELGCSSIPLSRHVQHRCEIDNECYILRTPFDLDGLEWCLDYCNCGEDTCNAVFIWNKNKDTYFKYLRNK